MDARADDFRRYGDGNHGLERKLHLFLLWGMKAKPRRILGALDTVDGLAEG